MQAPPLHVHVTSTSIRIPQPLRLLSFAYFLLRARRFVCCKSEGMSKKSAAKRKGREADDVDWDALLGGELEGGVDLDDMGQVLVNNSKIW
jgi:hypothetical protein